VRANGIPAVALLENAARAPVVCRLVVQRLRMQADTFPFVLAGGIFQAVPWLTDALTQRLSQLAPHASVVRLTREPALGAVTLALAAAKDGVRLPSYLPR
jgi:N-acetylglucosamine kinase-like BadF-type ATPase